MNPRQIEVTRGDEITSVRIIARKVVDQADIDGLGQELLELLTGEAIRKLVVNLSQVDFLSSAALGRFVVLRKVARQHGARLVLTELQPTIRELFLMTKLDHLLEIKETDAEAIQSLGG